MSVALQSPFTGTKRLFDDADSEAQQHHHQQQEAAKRVRCLGSPAGRCRPAAHAPTSHFQPSIPASTVAAIKALFPGMDSQVGPGWLFAADEYAAAGWAVRFCFNPDLRC
jgi:hypothetical protein